VKIALTLKQFGTCGSCENTLLIERLRNRTDARARVALFDFDGTVALVRAGWMPLMLDMMMETLAPQGDNRAP
jgi:hypothetical protein